MIIIEKNNYRSFPSIVNVPYFSIEYDPLSNKFRIAPVANSCILSNPQEQAICPSFQPIEKVMKHYINKIKNEKYEGPKLPLSVAKSLMEANKRNEAERYLLYLY